MGAQGFNRYNLFYRLERHLLLHQRGVETPTSEDATPTAEVVERYKYLELPPAPSRYKDLVMTSLWFVSSKGSGKKRSHRKSHGAASFTEIAQIVASNWKSIDDETMAFVTTVSSLLKKYIIEHEIDIPKKKTKKRKSNKQQSSPTNPHEISEESLNYTMAVQSSLQIDIETLDTLQNNPFSHGSSTPLANNLTRSDMALSHNDVLGGQFDLCQPISGQYDLCQPIAQAPTSSQQQIIPNITGSDDNLVNSTEQSFLSHIFSSNNTGESGEVDGVAAQEAPTNLQQQTVTDLLAQMCGNSNPRPNRRASMPDMPFAASRRIASLAEAELESRRGELHGVSSPKNNKRQRRASTMGSPKEGMKEVDMSNEEIFQIWRASSPSYSPTGHNRAA